MKATLLLMAMFWPFHHSTDRQFVADSMATLKDAALTVGYYHTYPPPMTDPKADSLYIERAEDDISIALDELKKYEHGHAAKQDVETALSQLSRDLEDIPPDSPDYDPRAKS